MFDPTDDLLSIFRQGDAQVMPGAPTAGVDGETPDTEYTAPPGREPVMWWVREPTVDSTGITLTADDRPDYWLVANTNATIANELMIWPYEVSAGDPVRILGTGYARMPAVSQHITLRAASTSVRCNVIGVRGYDNMQIVPAGGL